MKNKQRLADAVAKFEGDLERISDATMPDANKAYKKVMMDSIKHIVTSYLNDCYGFNLSESASALNKI